MEIKKQQTVDKVVGWLCDVCGEPCNPVDPEAWEFATLSAQWGFYSKKDQELHECHICELCYDKITNFIESLGGKVRVRNYHVLSGEPLGDWKCQS